MKLTFKCKNKSIRGMLEYKNPVKDLIVMTHGFKSHSDTPYFITLKDDFIKLGYGVLRFDFSGHGQSKGDIEETTLSLGLDDLENMVQVVKEHFEIMPRIILFGRSYGGQIALLYACKHTIYKLVAICPSVDFKEIEDRKLGPKGIKKWKKDGYITKGKIKLNYSFYEDLSVHETYEIADKITCETVIIHGTEDQMIPIEQSRKLSGKSDKINLIEIVGGDHRFVQEQHRLLIREYTNKFLLVESR